MLRKTYLYFESICYFYFIIINYHDVCSTINIVLNKSCREETLKLYVFNMFAKKTRRFKYYFVVFFFDIIIFIINL